MYHADTSLIRHIRYASNKTVIGIIVQGRELQLGLVVSVIRVIHLFRQCSIDGSRDLNLSKIVLCYKIPFTLRIDDRCPGFSKCILSIPSVTAAATFRLLSSINRHSAAVKLYRFSRSWYILGSGFFRCS